MAKKKQKLGIKKTGGSSNVNPLVPEIPFNAPAGSYDVGLDAALRGSKRGLAQLIEDAATGQQRDDNDYLLGKENIERGRDESISDLDTRNSRFTRDLGHNRQRGGEDYTKGKGRLSEDYTTGKGRLGEDYQSTVAGLLRNYQRLGSSQRQGALSAGYTGQGGGAVAQAARKRAENQAWDRKPIDTNFQRGNQDMDRGFQRGNQDLDTGWNRQQQDWNTAESDWGTDYQTGRQRITDGATRDLGGLGLAGIRSYQDRGTQVQRAKDETGFFGEDTQAAKVQQVQQTTPGWMDQWKQRNDKRGFRTFKGR
jgi:hypothetical protein